MSRIIVPAVGVLLFGFSGISWCAPCASDLTESAALITDPVISEELSRPVDEIVNLSGGDNRAYETVSAHMLAIQKTIENGWLDLAFAGSADMAGVYQMATDAVKMDQALLVILQCRMNEVDTSSADAPTETTSDSTDSSSSSDVPATLDSTNQGAL